MVARSEVAHIHEEKDNFRYDFIFVARFDLAFKANFEIFQALISSLQLFREALAPMLDGAL